MFMSTPDTSDDVNIIFFLHHSGSDFAANVSLLGTDPPSLKINLLHQVVLEVAGINQDPSIVPLGGDVLGRVGKPPILSR